MKQILINLFFICIFSSNALSQTTKCDSAMRVMNNILKDKMEIISDQDYNDLLLKREIKQKNVEIDNLTKINISKGIETKSQKHLKNFYLSGFVISTSFLLALLIIK